MHFLNILFAAVAALATLSAFTLAGPIATNDVRGAPPPPPEDLVCCLAGCTTCSSSGCGKNNRGCGSTFFPTCCALAFTRGKRDDGTLVAYNQRGELVTFVSAPSE